MVSLLGTFFSQGWFMGSGVNSQSFEKRGKNRHKYVFFSFLFLRIPEKKTFLNKLAPKKEFFKI